MITKNGESTKGETPRAWGDKETIQSGIDSNQRGGTRQTSREVGSEPITTDRNDWARGNFSDQCGQGTVGGIVDRLIEKVAHLVEESEHRTAELKQQLAELRQFSTQIQKNEYPE
ncbi:hypothetical protein H6G36_02295 [Anabaena minutissima FACHB-250]|nr:hypothetical protein [Anabaena minutissima FACHB-250]